MTTTLQNPFFRLPVIAVVGAGLLLLLVATARAQRDPVHYFHDANLPPGTVGQGQLLRGGPLPGYFQPVEIRVPDGAAVSLLDGAQFGDAESGPVMAGMLIGQVYRFKVSRIPQNPGFEVFPTIEVINRLYPPKGLKDHFPIPVQLTQEELEMALSGLFVTRVIYLEDPQNALPIRERADEQIYYEVRSDQDPLQAADRLGRPMAILRMGSRVPDEVVAGGFIHNSPPLQRIARPAPLPDPQSGLEEPIAPPGANEYRDIPRVPLPEPTTGGAAWHGRPNWYR